VSLVSPQISTTPGGTWIVRVGDLESALVGIRYYTSAGVPITLPGDATLQVNWKPQALVDDPVTPATVRLVDDLLQDPPTATIANGASRAFLLEGQPELRFLVTGTTVPAGADHLRIWVGAPGGT